MDDACYNGDNNMSINILPRIKLHLIYDCSLVIIKQINIDHNPSNSTKSDVQGRQNSITIK